MILLIQKMPLLCVHSSGLAALAPSSLTFQRGEGPLLVAFGFVKDDTAACTIPVLDLLWSRDEVGAAARKEIEERVVTVSLQDKNIDNYITILNASGAIGAVSHPNSSFNDSPYQEEATVAVAFQDAYPAPGPR